MDATRGICAHMVYCHYPREVVHIPEVKDGRVVVILDKSGLEGQPLTGGAAGVQVTGLGQETEIIIEKVVYGIKSGGRGWGARGGRDVSVDRDGCGGGYGVPQEARHLAAAKGPGHGTGVPGVPDMARAQDQEVGR